MVQNQKKTITAEITRLTLGQNILKFNVAMHQPYAQVVCSIEVDAAVCWTTIYARVKGKCAGRSSGLGSSVKNYKTQRSHPVHNP